MGEVAAVRAFPAPLGPLDLHLRVGDIVLLRGPNGSGKSSLLRSLAGLASALAPASVTAAGNDPRTTAAPQLTGAMMAQDPRDGLVGLTVRGEFDLRATPLPATCAGLAGRDVATLSSGEARRVAQAAALCHGRPLLLLDEPVEGLDAQGRHDLRDAILAHAGVGAVVVADHSGLLDDVATRRVELGSPSPPFAVAATPVARPTASATLHFAARIVDREGTSVTIPALSLGPGLHAIVGSNGAGKSTLLLAVAGLLPTPPVAGDVVPAARSLLPRARLMLWRQTVANHLDGCDPEVRAAFVPASLADRSPLSLSGGETQRVALAQVLGHPSPLYLLDEPEAHLDDAGRDALARVLARRLTEGSTILVATHDPALLAACHARTEVRA